MHGHGHWLERSLAALSQLHALSDVEFVAHAYATTPRLVGVANALIKRLRTYGLPTFQTCQLPLLAARAALLELYAGPPASNPEVLKLDLEL